MERIQFSPLPGSCAQVTGYLHTPLTEMAVRRERFPAVVLCPGGAYAMCSQREADPVALRFFAAGYQVFTLLYSTGEKARNFQPLQELSQTFRLVRERAGEYRVDPEKIAVCGFSAGGHLAASTGVFWNRDWVRKLGFLEDSHKPNGLILSYPVITGGEFAHRGSFENLLGDQYSDELVELNSLEKQVSKDTPRCFVWHTSEDGGVPVQNSLLFASALANNGVPFELHVYPHGEHGLSLANELVCDASGVLPKVQSWVPFAKEWIFGR